LKIFINNMKEQLKKKSQKLGNYINQSNHNIVVVKVFYLFMGIIKVKKKIKSMSKITKNLKNYKKKIFLI
jgi:hypothetical protein